MHWKILTIPRFCQSPPPPLVASDAVHSKAVVLLLCCCGFNIYCCFRSSDVCQAFELCPWFVIQYLVSFLALQSSGWGRESWLLYFNCVLAVVWLFECCVSLPRPAMDWSVIVAFPSHSHLLFINKAKVNTVIRILLTYAVADPEGVRLNPPPRPVFKYPMKMKYFGLGETKLFYFHGNLRKMK